MNSGSRKSFEAAGYDQEEMYFHKVNRELIEKHRGSSKNLPAHRHNVLEFKRPERKIEEPKVGRGDTTKKAA